MWTSHGAFRSFLEMFIQVLESLSCAASQDTPKDVKMHYRLHLWEKGRRAPAPRGNAARFLCLHAAVPPSVAGTHTRPAELQFLESQNRNDWKRPLRSPSTTTNPSPPRPSWGATSPRSFNPSVDGDSTTNLGSSMFEPMANSVSPPPGTTSSPWGCCREQSRAQHPQLCLGRDVLSAIFW